MPTPSDEGRLIAGRYALRHVVGRGGMSSVWVGRDTVLERDVALKPLGLLPGQESPDLARAEREARLAARLDHTHVVGVFDLLTDRGEQWLVMEYVEGRNLAELVADRGPLPPDAAARVLGQAADALAAAHRAGIVHRDVKPSNILVRPDGQVKLTDFGIARAYSDPTLTATGLMTGSPAYLSPEVASGSPATAASDVWALGATLFHALTGEPPYDARGNVMGALYRIVHEEPPRPRDAGWLAPVLEHTMAKDPADRWSMDEVRDRLLRRTTGPLTTGRPDTAPTMVTPTVAAPPSAALPSAAPSVIAPLRQQQPTRRSEDARPRPSARPGRSRRLPAVVLWGALALLVLALVVGAYLLANRNDRTSGSGDNAGRSSGQGSGSAGPSGSPSRSSSPSGTGSPSQTGKPTGKSSGGSSVPPATEGSMQQFVRDYLATVTEDPRTTFGLLSPQYQRASGGFAGYQAFWSTIAKAKPKSIHPDPGALTVSYDVEYEKTDGSKTQEAVTLLLERTADGYLIAGER